MKRVWILLLCLSLLFASSCGSVQEDEPIRALVFEPSYDLVEELAVGQIVAEHYFTIVTYRETFFWDVEFVSTDESVATVRFEKMAGDIYVYYAIEAIAEGEAYVYFTADGGKVESERIRVIVTQETQDTEPEETKPEETKPEETEPEETESEGEALDDDRIVYVTKTGTKYHYSKSCAGKNAIEVTLSEAQLTKTPCKTCAREESAETTEVVESDSETTAPEGTDSSAETTESRIVYVTPSGKRYHYSKSCAGNNAKETTMDEAIAAGKTPCGTCAKN